jgi:inorganic pyrophosphatase
MKSIILELEKRLLVKGIRSNAEALSDLLAQDFIEYGASGKIFTYKPGDVFSDFIDRPIEYSITNFDITNLSEVTILAKYTIQTYNENGFISFSNRSTIWKCFNGKWKAIFHQGTPVSTYSINTCNYWNSITFLLKSNRIIIDRPKGTIHPKYKEIIYPLDYGYIENTSSMDGNGIDVFIGNLDIEHITGIICTYDNVKKDSEIKIMYKCNESDINTVLGFFNSDIMSAIYVHNSF